MAISSIMTTPVVTVGPDETLLAIKEIFDTLKFHHLLVVDQNRLFGVISDRDLLKAFSPWLGTLGELPRDRALLERRAHQICSRKPITTHMKTSVIEASNIMIENDISCLPVVTKQGRVRGIVTWKDIFKAYYKFMC